MDWSSGNALKILADMPRKLSAKNLETVQSEIDKEKLAFSIEMNRDLCGEYAPFCAFCDKTSPYPCAVALVNYKRRDGVMFEIAISDGETEPETSVSFAATAATAESENITAQKSAAESQTDGAAVAVEETEAEPASADMSPLPEKETKRIRIAVAKRRH